MHSQTPQTNESLQHASFRNVHRFAFDWVDALGILALMSGLGFLCYLVEVEISPTLASACVLGFPVARRRLLGAPIRTVSRRFSLLGLLATVLIVFGTLGGGFLVFAVTVSATREVAPPPVFESSISVEFHLPENATPEQREAHEAQRQAQEREQREFLAEQERLAREALARDKEERQAHLRMLLLWFALPVGMIVLGAFLDRLGMRREAAT